MIKNLFKKSTLVLFLENYDFKKKYYENSLLLRILISRYISTNDFLFKCFVLSAISFIMFSNLPSLFLDIRTHKGLETASFISFVFMFSAFFTSSLININIARKIKKQCNIKTYWFYLPFGIALKLKTNKIFIDIYSKYYKKEYKLKFELEKMHKAFYYLSNIKEKNNEYSMLNKRLMNIYFILHFENTNAMIRRMFSYSISDLCKLEREQNKIVFS